MVLSETAGTEQSVTVKTQTMHPNYNPTTFANDICILTLNNDLSLNSNVAIVNLDTTVLNIVGTYSTGIVSGWGTNSSG